MSTNNGKKLLYPHAFRLKYLVLCMCAALAKSSQRGKTSLGLIEIHGVLRPLFVTPCRKANGLNGTLTGRSGVTLVIERRPVCIEVAPSFSSICHCAHYQHASIHKRRAVIQVNLKELFYDAQQFSIVVKLHM